ncbi:unnamed protein product [Rotaria sordida]|uniref:Roquin II domain-containing protein n=1 Tax=Rotaria sordida TaxID=392033 RepID=A0A815KH56_9BILA|nr:unnamed protein product [Rotaria sordida]CAF1621189.1 unnamed protein product [Rotaria sordida]
MATTKEDLAAVESVIFGDNGTVVGGDNRPIVLEEGIKGSVVTVNRTKHYAFIKRRDKPEYRDLFVREASIVGFYMTPEQWSLLLYGYTTNESIIDLIIDKLLTKTSFETAIKQYQKIVLSSSAVHSQGLVNLMEHFQFFSNANLVTDASGSHVLTSALHMLKKAVSSLNK